jgi:hypothetical protein
VGDAAPRRVVSPRDLRRVPWRVGALATICALLLCGCDPAPVPDRVENADLSIHVEPDGSAQVSLRLAREVRAQLDRTADEIAPLLFDAGIPSVRIDANGGGADFAVITVAKVYEAGSTSVVELSVGQEVLAVLGETGAETVDVNFCVPYVPFEMNSFLDPDSEESRCRFWRLDVAGGSLDATLTMRPDTSRWYRSVVFATITLLSAVAAYVLSRGPAPVDRRRRIR